MRAYAVRGHQGEGAVSSCDADQIVNRIDAARRPGMGTMVAIAGAPGSGKSTISQRLVATLVDRDGPGAAALVPMDGYHLDNADLDALGLRHVKGAPETFDVAGFVSLVRRIRAGGMTVEYPLFDRALDKTIPGAGQLAAGTPVVVFEGNYLLLQDGAWADLSDLFDVTVMLSVPLDALRARLIGRWLAYGLSQNAAEARADSNDMANARLVIANSASADLILGSDIGENP